jgi:hypothetical protein
VPIFDVDSRAIAKHVQTLQGLHRSALPVVIRQTLNAAALDVKRRTMPKESDVFTHRKATFFKANSGVNFAQGLDVNTMQSEVGFKPKAGDKSHSVEDLQEQEHGGAIPNRALIALPKARVGGSWDKNVQVKNRLGNIRKNLVDSRNNVKRGKQGFIRSALHAGVGGYVLNQDHSRILLIKSISRVGNRTVVKTDTIESVKKGRKAKVKATHFMQKATLETQKEMEVMFVGYAEKKIMSMS